jgi:hypothetical protein
MPIPFILFFILIGVLIVFGAIHAHKTAQARQAALFAWATENGLSHSLGEDRELEHRFPLHDCLRQGSNRYAENVIEGEIRGRGLCAFDYHYETHSTDSKGRRQTHHHHFSAVVLECGLPLKKLFLRPENFLDKITEFVGIDDIDFELAEFSRKFYVKAPDRRWAFDVLHQETMEFLLESPRFTVEMAGPWVMARKSGRFKVEEFSAALAVAEGILDRLPKYLLRELKGEDS